MCWNRRSKKCRIKTMLWMLSFKNNKKLLMNENKNLLESWIKSILILPSASKKMWELRKKTSFSGKFYWSQTIKRIKWINVAITQRCRRQNRQEKTHIFRQYRKVMSNFVLNGLDSIFQVISYYNYFWMPPKINQYEHDKP